MLDELTNLTMDLIRVPSTQDNPDALSTCANFIGQYLDRIDVSWSRLSYNDVPSIMVMPRTGKVPVLLLSHFDVVDAPDPLFEPWIKDNKLFGRGSIDDKYAVALSLILLKNHLNHLRQNGRDQSGLPFGILLTGDEETGGVNGAQMALKQVKADFCIALDGGGLDKIVIREKGIFRLKLISRGKACHGARPWLGENAIEKLMRDYFIIKGFFDDTDSNHWHRTLTISIVHAGKAQNQVPDYAEAVLDIRYTEQDDMLDLIGQLRTVIQGEIQILSTAPVFSSLPSPFLDRLLNLSPKTVTGSEHGASDARHLMNHNIPGIVWGADGDMSQHSMNEHINLDSFEALYQILDQFLFRLRT
ncbi:MAG: M20/M25/M40 family metallo-hydrolase [Desulfatirhabdiaceae bacterium]